MNRAFTRPPVLRLHHDELIVDSFAGGGGASLGITMALGRGPDVAINHDPEALALHAANHPETEHYQQDVWAVDPVKACAGRRVGLAWFSPDCFPAGTMVLTRDGYRAIEQLAVGDEVLTHRQRWRAVTEVSSTKRPLLRVRGHGHPGLLVSPEHPFYTRDNERDLPRWQPASALDRGLYWSTPTQFPEEEPPPVPVYRQRSLTFTPEVFWLVGRYVADGWTRLTQTRAELVITCGKHEVEGLRMRLSMWPRAGARSGTDELAWSERETDTAYQFTVNHRGLVEWLREHFGHGASEKVIPGWALGMTPDLRASLLAGYLSGDGWQNDTFAECTTVSKALAFGIKALACSLGKTVSVYTGHNTSVIQGRTVNARDYYRLRWRHAVDAAHAQTWRANGLEWTPIREREDHVEGLHEVFNIGVEGDESYVVEGIVVHNCKHFSKAKGGKPVEKKIRGLAWVVVRWAKAVKPRVIILENVEEFQDWGPLLEDGKPCPERRGLTFRRWLGALKACGYQVEARELRACDYGAPTSRKRLFIIARSDGGPIVWPAPTHGAGLLPYRTAAECIQWQLPCPSIFERERPLAENTLKRIARGLRRYVIEAPEPFVVPLTHHGERRSHLMSEPLPTVTGAHRGELALVAPSLVQTGYGERPGQSPRALDLQKPLGTVVGGGQKHALVSAFLARHYGGNENDGAALQMPMFTVTTKDHHALVASNLVKLYGTSTGADVCGPMPTVTATGQHLAEVRAFLVKYYGTEQDPQLTMPLHTVTTKDRFGLVTVHGAEYVIADIGMRMLAPRELFRAQGFPDSYRIDIEHEGKPLSKSAQVRMCGNSVVPPLAAALVRAQFQLERATEAA